MCTTLIGKSECDMHVLLEAKLYQPSKELSNARLGPAVRTRQSSPLKDAIRRPACNILGIRARKSVFLSFGNRSECRGQHIKENMVAGSSRLPLYQIKVPLSPDGSRPAVHQGSREGDCDTSMARLSGTPPMDVCK